jgi:hypothetical protein
MKTKLPKKKITSSIKLVLTNEDWYPTLDGNLVSVALYTYYNDDVPYACRVSVWGGDDYGMGIDLRADELWKATYIFDRIVDPISINDLKQLGLKFE